MTDDLDDLDAVTRLTKDLKLASVTLSIPEVRFLVDSYYSMQDDRKRADNQVRALNTSGEPHDVLNWLLENSRTLENQIKRALDAYSNGVPLGQWARSICGIGPVLAAGLLAHINVENAPTVGRIWRFAGYDPTVIWHSKDNAKKMVTQAMDGKKKVDADVVAAAAKLADRTVDQLERTRVFFQKIKKEGATEKGWTQDMLASTIAVRPWNARLKTLCWKIGESFVKVKGKEEDFYGKVYEKRKEYETAKNDKGDYKGQADAGLKRVGRSTEAYKHYKNGKLPPGRIHERAKRYAVKLFLAHYHDRGLTLLGKVPPLPYPIAHMDHAHFIPAPGA